MTPTHSRTYYAPIDGVRALSVLAVLCYHAALPTSALTLSAFGPLLSRLIFAIALFFMVSGFVLYRPMVIAQRQGRPLDATAFWGRRLARIVPAYWFAFLVCISIPYVRDAYSALHMVDAGDLWRYLGFAQTYSARTAPLGFGHAWTLGVDFLFYALLPLYALAVGRIAAGRRLRTEVIVLVALGLTSLGLRTWTYAIGHKYPFNLTLAGNALWIAGGMLLAVLSVHVPDARPLRSARLHPGRWLLGAAGTYIVLTRIGLPKTDLAPYSGFDWFAEHVGAFIIAMLIMTPIAAGASAERAPMRLLTLRPLRELSEISYEFYLWHLPLMLVMVRIGVVRSAPGSPYLALLVCTAAATGVAAAITHYGFSRPVARAWARRTRVDTPSPVLAPALREPPP